MFLPFLTGERNPDIGHKAFGAILGIRPFHDIRHLSRAVLEGVAFGIRFFLDLLRENGIEVEAISVGGGATRSKLWMEILADVLGETLEVSSEEETGLKGAALLALTALGVYPSLEAAYRRSLKRLVKITPTPKDAYEKGYLSFKEAISVLRPLFG